MKKYLSKAFAATSTALLLTCLSACGGTSEADTSRIAALEQSLSVLKSEKSELAKERDRYSGLYQDLEKQLAALSETESELSKCKDDLTRITDLNEKSNVRIQELEDRIESLESRKKELTSLLADTQKKLSDAQKELADAKTDRVISKKTSAESKITLTLYWEGAGSKLVASYPDGRETTAFSSGRMLYCYNFSPDGKKVIMSDFELEGIATIRLYDTEKRETSELTLPGLPADKSPSYIDWIDGRYLLTVVQLDIGTVSMGGDLYVYDTETSSCRVVVKNSNRFQTVSFDQYDGVLMVNSVQYDETMNFTEPKHHILKTSEIMELWESGKTVDLSTVTPLNS